MGFVSMLGQLLVHGENIFLTSTLSFNVHLLWFSGIGALEIRSRKSCGHMFLLCFFLGICQT
jgi:hypothetical protein